MLPESEELNCVIMNSIVFAFIGFYGMFLYKYLREREVVWLFKKKEKKKFSIQNTGYYFCDLAVSKNRFKKKFFFYSFYLFIYFIYLFNSVDCGGQSTQI